MIPTHTIDAIRDATDLRTLVQEYGIKLTRGVALCPFHSEKTPSLRVYPRYWYCHGCHATGSCYGWLQQIEPCTFYAALKLLSARTGIPLDSKPATRIQSHHDRQDRLMFPWWKQRHLDACTAAIDLEDYAWSSCCGRIMQAVQAFTLQDFRNLVTVVERKQYAAHVEFERSFAALWIGLVA